MAANKSFEADAAKSAAPLNSNIRRSKKRMSQVAEGWYTGVSKWVLKQKEICYEDSHCSHVS
jgi:hypothetical protein